MKVLLNKELGPILDCPYIPGNKSCNEFFLAYNLSSEELDELLETGWRKFGLYFYRPKCPNCQSCLPLRVIVNQFIPSKGHKKILKKNSDIQIKMSPLEFRDEIYELYAKHSKQRFGQETTAGEFKISHFYISCPSIQMEYYLKDQLVAVGFLDLGKNGLSSVYFIFDPEHSKRSLGVFGALYELDYAKKRGLSHYYLGYFISANSSMTYKSQFTPFEIYKWNSQRWESK